MPHMQTNNNPNGPKTRQPSNPQPEQATGREGGDEALANSSLPNDARADEKVIVNEQREDKIVNTPSQTAAHNEHMASDDEIINQ